MDAYSAWRRPGRILSLLRTALGVEDAVFQDIYWRNRAAYDLDAISAATYWQGVAQAAGATFAT